MSETPLNKTLTQEQQDYEAMYGTQPEWHIDIASLTSGAHVPADDDSDDAIYRRLFG